MMNLELYCASGSLCSQKVKLVLAEKNLEWNNHLLNLLTFANLQPSYMRLNPKGVVPTLLHNGRVITDSAIIIRYLDEQFPYPKLIPAEPKLQETMSFWIDLQNQFPMRELVYGNYKGIEGIILRRSVQIKEKLLPKLIQRNPELAEKYTSKLKDVTQWNRSINSSDEIASLNKQVELILDRLETQLSQTDWLCGVDYSLADVVWTVVLNGLDELKFSYLWEDNVRPAIDKYFIQLKVRPSFKIAITDDKMPFPMLLAGLRRIFIGV